ncbi:MAG: response regulator [Nitrospira sp. CR1.3]|nr:response regulator [Nitrospira sp. CR1.3]
MSNRSCILLIDDSPGECELFRQALARADLDVALYAEHDAEAALHFLSDRAGREPLPAVVLLDWRLRNERGDGFLRKLRADHRLAVIPVVVFSTSDDVADLSAAYANGTNSYVVKPGTFDELVRCVRVMCRFWINCNVTPHMVESRC